MIIIFIVSFIMIIIMSSLLMIIIIFMIWFDNNDYEQPLVRTNYHYHCSDYIDDHGSSENSCQRGDTGGGQRGGELYETGLGRRKS